jgi:multiple sugar transport system permease protein
MKKKRIFSLAAWLALAVILVWSLFPILFIFTSSLKPPAEIFEYPPSFLGHFSFRNYVDLARDWKGFFPDLLNSLIITIFSVVITTLFSLPTAYAFSRYRGRYIRLTGFFLIAARMFPPIIITIPFYPVFQRLGLMDRHITLVFFYSAFYVSISTWILKNFIDMVPRELEEAAHIEGCSKFQSFVRIVLPLISPGILSLGILVALFCWKEFLFAFLFSTKSARTAPVALNEMLGAMFGVSWGPLFAAAALHLLPILILIWLFQNVLIEGTGYGIDK